MNTQGWAMRLDRRDVAAAGRLRLVADVEVCEQPNAVWLRGPQAGDELHWQLAAVAGARRFSVLTDGQLLPCGARVPQGWLPQGPWTALGNGWAWNRRQHSLQGGTTRRSALPWSARIAWKKLRSCLCGLTSGPLMRSMPPRFDSTVGDLPLPTTAARWFAVNRNQDRLQTYPTPCRRYRASVGSSGKALPYRPAGHGRPPSKPAVLRQVFGLAEGDVALWHVDGAWEKIAAEEFVRATRAAVRATKMNVQHGA